MQKLKTSKYVCLTIFLLVFSVGCAGESVQIAYYKAQSDAIKAQSSSMVEITGNITSVKLPAYLLSGGSGPVRVQQYKDPAYELSSTVLGIGLGVLGLWVSGENMVRLADTVGQHAGDNYTSSLNPSGFGIVQRGNTDTSAVPTQVITNIDDHSVVDGEGKGEITE